MKSLFFVLLFCVCSIVYSAPPPPPAGAPACWPPPCVPIDNGIFFLIIAGALFGLKKIYEFRKKQQVIS